MNALCYSVLEQRKMWLFSVGLAVYITIPPQSTLLRMAICMAQRRRDPYHKS